MTPSRPSWKPWLALLLPAFVFFAWIWNSDPVNLKDRVFPKHLHEVYPGFLYRSGQISAGLIGPTVRDLGIDVIIDLGGESTDPAQSVERELARKSGIEYLPFHLRGNGEGAVEQYVGAVEAIARAEQAGRQVLVHCRAGDRRTGGVIAAYQLLVRGEPTQRALAEVQRYSPGGLEDSPVLAYLLGNLGEIADGLRARGVEVRSARSDLETRNVPLEPALPREE